MTTNYGHNLVLLKFTIKQLEIVELHFVQHRIDAILRSCESVQHGGQSLKLPIIRDKYPRDVVKPVVKPDVNSMRSSCHDDKDDFIGYLLLVKFLRALSYKFLTYLT